MAFLELEQPNYLLYRCIVIHDRGWHSVDEGHSSKDSIVTRTKQPCQDKNLTHWYPYSRLSRRVRVHWERSGDSNVGIWFSICLTVGTLVMMVLYG